MSFNSVGQYSANHKTWDHVGNMIPVVEHSEGIRPHGEFMPAAWLPVQFFEKFYENWVVCMPGKILAFDNDGRVVPAQYGVAGVSVVYTANDVDAGVIDVRSGVALTAAATFTVASVTAFLGRTGEAMAVSKPIGVAPYPILQWAGDGSAYDDGFNPTAYSKHNYNMQHRVAILCDYVLELPVVPAKTTTGNLTLNTYSSTTKIATMNAVANLPVAANTQRTPISFTNGTQTDTATLFVNQVETAALVRDIGDWHINLTTGVVSVYRDGTPGAGPVIYKITYWNYASAPTGSSVSVFACVLGDVKPGSFLKCNADSNWVVDSAPSLDVTMGQVLDVELQPKDMLDKVRTAYSSIATDATGSLPGGTTSGQMDQMPGSATGGVSDKIHYAGAANKLVRVNLVSR